MPGMSARAGDFKSDDTICRRRVRRICLSDAPGRAVCRVFIAFENRENHIRNILRMKERIDFHFTDRLWKTRKRQEMREKISFCYELQRK